MPDQDTPQEWSEEVLKSERTFEINGQKRTMTLEEALPFLQKELAGDAKLREAAQLKQSLEGDLSVVENLKSGFKEKSVDKLRTALNSLGVLTQEEVDAMLQPPKPVRTPEDEPDEDDLDLDFDEDEPGKKPKKGKQDKALRYVQSLKDQLDDAREAIKQMQDWASDTETRKKKAQQDATGLHARQMVHSALDSHPKLSKIVARLKDDPEALGRFQDQACNFVGKRSAEIKPFGPRTISKGLEDLEKYLQRTGIRLDDPDDGGLLDEGLLESIGPSGTAASSGTHRRELNKPVSINDPDYTKNLALRLGGFGG